MKLLLIFGLIIIINYSAMTYNAMTAPKRPGVYANVSHFYDRMNEIIAPTISRG